MFFSRATNLSHRRVIVTKYRKEGQRLQEARSALRLTQAELAKRIGSSLAAVKGYERGVSAPNRDFSRALAALGINMEYVLNGTGDVLIPERSRDGHARMTGRVKSAQEGLAPYVDDDFGAGQLKAMDPMGEMHRIRALCEEVGYTPPPRWLLLLTELAVVEGLSERGARRILETLKLDEGTAP